MSPPSIGSVGKCDSVYAIVINYCLPFLGFWTIKSFRLYLTLIFGFAVLANAFIRNTLSMSMVCMINTTAVNEISIHTEINRSAAAKVNVTFDNKTCQSINVVKSEYEVRSFQSQVTLQISCRTVSI